MKMSEYLIVAVIALAVIYVVNHNIFGIQSIVGT